MSIDEFVEASAAARTPGELSEAFGAAIAAHGFEHFACTFLRPEPSSEDVVATAVAVQYPSGWIERYLEAGYAAVDPIIGRAAAAGAPYLWDELGALSPRQRRMFAEAAEFGLRHGICVPIHAPRGEVFVMSIAGSAPAADLRAMRRHLYLLSAQFRLAHEELLRPAPEAAAPPPNPLTARERECLAWSARGKSSWEISVILGISEFTAVFHVRNACAKLDAANRVLGIAKAIRLGLIAP
jgi:DNA-binding CsgD family transcriptional regulator